ncbi:hypothetical protein GIB67_035039 [Kingdonia uniflora]|uniref:Uncharacterized protein n=1 Tax=Kingdonia uniflora TaxID=39325 RepID=A0A7J7L1G5_9MAGN|nr:hypothetical protein GIB67_035039 [Kingdonia uniflora]
MLSSSSFSTGSSHEEDQEPQLPLPHSIPYFSPMIHMRQLLITCAELVSQSDFIAAHRLVSFLLSSTSSSAYGDSTDRVVHHFSRALSLRISRHTFFGSNTFLSSSSSASFPVCLQALESSYFYLNQVTPFVRFCHLTTNQAILEAVEGQQSIHIIDFDTMQGLQWPPLMQAIAERSDPLNPPFIRMTGTGHDMETLQRTGDRLQNFAQSMGLRFQFHPLLLLRGSTADLPSIITLLPHETLAVNCVFYMHKLLGEDSNDVNLFLQSIKSMNPKIVTLAEREANHNNPNFMQRFIGALDHYTTLFDALETTLPPNSQERLAVEKVWFGREIVDIVSSEGEERRERHERFESWVDKFRSSGFSSVPLSAYALTQAKLLLSGHYHLEGFEGYRLQIHDDSSFFLVSHQFGDLGASSSRPQVVIHNGVSNKSLLQQQQFSITLLIPPSSMNPKYIAGDGFHRGIGDSYPYIDGDDGLSDSIRGQAGRRHQGGGQVVPPWEKQPQFSGRG